MLRSQKSLEFRSLLGPEDLRLLFAKIEPDAWYPMESFERMGNVILREIAKGQLEAVRLWGCYSVDQIMATTPFVVAPGDAVETMMRFRVVRSTFFDFEALELPTLTDGQALVVIHYHMGPTAEEAASHQTMGFFERLLEVSGATDVRARFLERSWMGDPETLLEIDWTKPEA
jgi:hypothetical protein